MYAIIVMGYPGTGKTHIGKKLMNMNVVHIKSEQVRADLGFIKYNTNNSVYVKKKMIAMAKEYLNQNIPILFDASHASRIWRNNIKKELCVPTIIIETVCSCDLAKERITRRCAHESEFKTYNNPKIYDEYSSRYDQYVHDLENINNDSYLKYNSELEKFEEIIVSDIHKSIVDQIINIVLNKNTAN